MTRTARTVALLSGAALAGAAALGVGVASAGDTAPVTPATTIHGLPGNNAGFSDQVNGACPATNGNGACDGGIHNIASNPGQSGVAPADRDIPPACDMHGGLNQGYNRNC